MYCLNGAKAKMGVALGVADITEYLKLTKNCIRSRCCSCYLVGVNNLTRNKYYDRYLKKVFPRKKNPSVTKRVVEHRLRRC